ncbi:MAG: hypothetical protein LAO24_11690 [Acidobacteriia bacterium]|nr:hypothetical protein [Terriglobia bacterium]
MLNVLLAIAGCTLYGFAGWFLYRNPVKVLNFFFKQYEFQYGRFSLGFFRVFGAVMVGQAGLLAILSVAVALARIWGKQIG